MPEINLETFPSSKTEALALLYVQKKTYTDLTPEKLADDYRYAYKEIKKYFSEHKSRSDWTY